MDEQNPPARNDWFLVDLSGSTITGSGPDDPTAGPIALYWGEYDTPSDYFQRLISRPLDTLREDPRFARHGLKETWGVRTTIFNHHKGLNPRIGFVTAQVSSEDEEVYLTVYKHNP